MNNQKGIKILILTILFNIFFSNFFSSVFASVINKSYIEVASPSAIVIDNKTGRVLYQKNAYEKRAMASLTKIMTSILLVENCNMDEKITVPAQATWQGGSVVGLKKNDVLTARSLLYGMLLPSGNDCACTVAIYLGGTIENFAKMMNQKALEIGAKDTNFVTPHGLDDPNHYSTAYDLAIITKYALQNKYINEAVNTVQANINFGSFSKLLTNTNALLRTYSEVDGVKTGFTNNANRCLIASATQNGFRIITVILGADTTEKRFGDAKKLIQETFKRYEQKDISNYMNWYIKVPVYKGSIPYFEKKISESCTIPLTKEEYESIYIKQQIMPVINPPTIKGLKIGVIELYIENEKIYSTDVYSDVNIYKKTIFDYMKDGIVHMFDPIYNI